MVLLLFAPFAAFTPPYEEVRYSSVVLSSVVRIPLLFAGLAAISSTFIARFTPLRRRRGLVLAFTLQLVTLVAIVASGLVFLIAFADFYFDSAWLHWGFYASAGAAAIAAGLGSRALTETRHRDVVGSP